MCAFIYLFGLGVEFNNERKGKCSIFELLQMLEKTSELWSIEWEQGNATYFSGVGHEWRNLTNRFLSISRVTRRFDFVAIRCCVLQPYGSRAPAFFRYRMCCCIRSFRHVSAVSLLPVPFFNGENSSSRRTSQMANVLRSRISTPLDRLRDSSTWRMERRQRRISLI